MDKAKDGLVFVGFGAYRLASKLLKDHPDTMAKYIRKQRCMYAIIQEYSQECFQPKISRKIRTSILARKNNILIENKGNKGENKTENNVLFQKISIPPSWKEFFSVDSHILLEIPLTLHTAYPPPTFFGNSIHASYPHSPRKKSILSV